MVDERTVRSEASNIAADARKTRDLTDAESECLHDLLCMDEAFGALVTAQQNAVLLENDHIDVDDSVERLAADAAGELGDAIDQRINILVAVAKDVVAFADEVDALTWGVAIVLYKAGYKTDSALREASREELVAEANVNPELADRIKDDVGDVQEVADE